MIKKLFKAGIIATFGLAILFTPSQVSAASSLLTSITSYWKMDEASGAPVDSLATYNLTNNNTVTFGAGKINNTAILSGSTQSLNNNSIWGATGYPRSYAGWAKFDTVAAARDQAIVSVGDASIHYYSFKLRDSDDKLVFRSNNNTEAADVDTGITASADVWYHWAVVQNSATSVTLYVNSTKTNTAAATFTATVSQFYLGYLGRSGAWYMDGQIDEVGYWNRALTDAEVVKLYNGGTGLSYDFPETRRIYTITQLIKSMPIPSPFYRTREELEEEFIKVKS